MGPCRRRACGSSALACVLLALGACKSNEPPPAPVVEVVPPPFVAPAPDHLAPDELAEGPLSAFGVPLPRGAEIKGQFPGKIYASHPATLDALQKYFAPRLREVKAVWHPRGVTMDKVKIPSDPSVTLSVSIDADIGGRGSLIVIYDASERPVPDLPSEEARWNAVGMTKDGKIADPAHYH